MRTAQSELEKCKKYYRKSDIGERVAISVVTPSGILATLVAFAIIDCSAERTRAILYFQGINAFVLAQLDSREVAHKKATDNLSVAFCGDSIGNRTRVTAVKGRCLNRLTMEPY